MHFHFSMHEKTKQSANNYNPQLTQLPARVAPCFRIHVLAPRLCLILRQQSHERLVRDDRRETRGIPFDPHLQRPHPVLRERERREDGFPLAAVVCRSCRGFPLGRVLCLVENLKKVLHDVDIQLIGG